MSEGLVLGFIGLGVMGEPICRNMLQRSGATMLISDLNPSPQERLKSLGARIATPDQIATRADILFLSLPGGPQVEAIATTVLPKMRAGATLVDMSTAPLSLTRRLGAMAQERGVHYADAPVARTRAAAEAGTLAIMVGADPDTYLRIEPILSHAGDTILHCGPVGCGQTAKILNNMVLFQNVVALSEALALGRAAGMEGGTLFDIIAQGSGDSFALRNHGRRAMVPDTFPEQAFPTDYALKDLSYALEIAQDAGLSVPGADLARIRMEMAQAEGYGDNYFPVLARLTGKPNTA